jgi:hypothetical protein
VRRWNNDYAAPRLAAPQAGDAAEQNAQEDGE